jgi:L-ascorbate metabolism protein UlaG (beta-lactamase superfamily)
MLSLTWVGHSTVLLDVDGTRLLTDPLLRTRVAHLRRVRPVHAGELGHIDAVLISHGHYDHLDLASLRKLDPSIPVVVPRGLAGVLRRGGRKNIQEVEAWDELTFGPVTVRATPAEHAAGGGVRRGEPLGFVVQGSRSAYFAGDTDLFEGIDRLGPVDVALLPVWGWGRSIGPGHLNPQRAATAISLLRPHVAIPIHWGTYHPLHVRRAAFLTEPPLEFRRFASEVAPETRVEILGLGETFSLTQGAGAATPEEQGREEA